MKQTFKRRHLLQAGGTLAAGLTLIPLSRNAWAAQGPEGGKRLVVVFLRGAVDGLNVVVPHDEDFYYDARPTIAIPRPGLEGGALDLDGRFGLHPALARLQPYWQDKTLAFIHASGSPDTTRSHFDAQDYMESGTPGRKSTADGWMNRLLAALPGPLSATSALSFGPTLPRILIGPIEVSNVPTGRAATAQTPLDRPIVNVAFDKLYAADDAMGRAYRQGVEAHKKLLADVQQDMMAADNGAPGPQGFADDAQRFAKFVAQDPSIRLGFFALGGWDTHANQGSTRGLLALRLAPLAEGLAALVEGLGKAYADTTIVVMSEFGRTVRENGNGGTDHGRGNAMWVLGGPVNGGKVYGDWPGLAEDALYEGRELAVTTDFRSALAAVIQPHLGFDGATMARIFPEAPAAPEALARLMRA